MHNPPKDENSQASPADEPHKCGCVHGDSNQQCADPTCPNYHPAHKPEAGSTRPEMPPAEKRMICKACCTEVCSHGKCPNCHIRCKDCMEGELPAASVQQEPLSAEVCPSCSATDNKPYTDARGIQMRACGRCVIQWQSQPAAPRTQGRQELHEKEMLEVIDERDHWEEVIEKLAESAGCKEEWSNLHEHGDCIAERILELEAQARTQPSPKCPKEECHSRQITFNYAQYQAQDLDMAMCRKCGYAASGDLSVFFTALPEATKKEG